MTIQTITCLLLLSHLALLSNPAVAGGFAFPVTGSPEGEAPSSPRDPWFGAKWFSTMHTPPASAAPDSLPFEGYHPDSTNICWPHLAVVTGVFAGTVTAIHIYQRNAWWSGERTAFHFQEDGGYALNVDKAGHFFGGAFASWLGQKGMQWSGFSEEASVWGGFAIGSLFELYVEYEDGFGPNWGFSPGDAYADVLGAAWPVAQYYVEPLEHIKPKYSYYPSTKFRNGEHDGNAFDDYEGQTYWVGIHVNGLLPASIERYWPDWLAIAVGLAVRNMDTPEMQRNVLIALDYDFTKIIPGDSWLLRALKEWMNYVHFPAPAIQISPGYIAYGLYFF